MVRSTVRAIGYAVNGTAEVLHEFETAKPTPAPRDLRVRVEAISVNPVDFKVRTFEKPAANQTRILGWDAAGIVESIGSQVSQFKVGDKVFYAGAVNRQGANAEYHLVDERIVGAMPKSLSFAEAAALPLTSITAWEILFDRMRIPRGERVMPGVLLVIAAAGGVGSVLVQLARALTGLTVIGTASRPESAEFVRRMGAHHVIDHRQPLEPQLKSLGFAGVEYLAALTTTPENLPDIVRVLKPQAHVNFVDDPVIGLMPFKPKSVTISWEMMFTRSLFQTEDMIEQHLLLNEVAALLDAGVLRTTLTRNAGRLTATNLAEAHRLLESGRAIGKTVLEGFH
jgi:zinc-binding alcohol dehydrogenase family protein